MKTREDYFVNDTQSERIYLKEDPGKDITTEENANFTREDYVEINNEINYLINNKSHDTTSDNSMYGFIVVWQRYE